VEAELFHVGGRTDVTKLIVALGNFANAPKTRGGYWPLCVRVSLDSRKTDIQRLAFLV
jgi:hypothetical protein